MYIYTYKCIIYIYLTGFPGVQVRADFLGYLPLVLPPPL